MHKILITGGAGFIGSNIVEFIVKSNIYDELTILDNLSTGNFNNIKDIIQNNRKIKFIKGDFRDYDVCLDVTKGIDIVCHQGAIPSVPRSINDPIGTNDNNVTGTLNLLMASKENKVKRFVYASSSSVYGNNNIVIKSETQECKPISPYAVSKYAVELYAKIFYDLYGIETIGLRYFNIFGPRQNPKSFYSAVIPKFIYNTLNNLPSTINGDGSATRDFTYVGNVIQANMMAFITTNKNAFGKVFNIGCGNYTKIIDLYHKITTMLNKPENIIIGERNKAEVQNSVADISMAKEILNYRPTINIDEGLKITLDYYIKN